MLPDLLKAHKVFDKAVMGLYGYPSEMSEPEIVADLMVYYQKLVDSERRIGAADSRAGEP